MRAWELFDLGIEYLIQGILLSLILGLVAFVVCIIHKKRLGVGMHFPWKRILLYGGFSCYLLVVLGVTTFSRGGYYEDSIRLQLFYSYRDAWNDFSWIEWRNIILNILMFVPLGILLPYIHRFFQKAGWTYLAGLGLTVAIEFVQLILKCGIFEMDDLMNNLIGTMIGYGVFRLHKDWHDKRNLFYQIPLGITVAAFVGIFVCYDLQELGNLHSEYIVRQNVDEVITELVFSGESQVRPVYRVDMASLDDTKAVAESVFRMFADELEPSTEDAYENMVLYRSEDQKSVWIDFRGKTYRYTDFKLLFGDTAEDIDSDADEYQVRSALEQMGIYMPEGMRFSFLDGKYQFKAELIPGNDLVYDGVIECEYTKTGKIRRLDYSLLECCFYKEFEIISQKEAYQRLVDGEFYYPRDEKWKIEIYDAYLVYEIDSKGFYQPVYRFDALINNNDGYIIIPAIDK